MSPPMKPPDEKAYTETVLYLLRAIEGKVDAITSRLDTFQEHCRLDMAQTYDRMRDVEAQVNLMKGSKVNPYWVYALISAATLVVGLILGKGGLH